MADNSFTTFATFSEADPWFSPTPVMQHFRVLMRDLSGYIKDELNLDHFGSGLTVVSAA